MTDADQPRSFVVAYGFAHGGKSICWHGSELLFAFYLTEACGLPPRQMGLVLGGSLLLNAVADLVVGRVLTTRAATVAQACRVQWYGAIVSSVAFAIFGLAGLVETDVRFAFALVSIVAFRLAYAFLDNPQNAMLALATQDDQTRARLSSMRYICGGLANLLVTLAFVPLLRVNNGAINPSMFALFAGLAASATLVSAGVLRLVNGASVRLPTARATPTSENTAISTPRINRWPIFAIMILISAATSVFNRLEPYFVTFDARTKMEGAALMLCVAVGTITSQPFWAILARRFTLVTTLRAAATILLLGSLAFGLFSRAGVAISAMSGLLYGAGSGGILMSLWALAAAGVDTLDPSKSATITFARLTFSAKLALGATAVGLGEWLVESDYRWQSEALAAPMGLAPAAGAISCLALSVFLSEKNTRASAKSRPSIPHSALADQRSHQGSES